MRRALSSLAEDGLMDVPVGDTGGHGDHFTVTDRLFDAALIEGSHAKYAAADAEESVGRLLDEMSEAQRALRDLATTLVVAMYLDNVT